MKYFHGYNDAVTTLEDVLHGGTGITLPTIARVHAVVSSSEEDDNTAQAQVETATVAGTVTTSGNATVTVTSAGMTGSGVPINVAVVAGTLQVETATVVGSIGAAGQGNATVTVTSALLAEPFVSQVAVANNDTAAQVGGKIRAALNGNATITDIFTVSGANENIILTAVSKAANDTTLNIAIANGTCTGLTAAPTSANTTPGVAQDTANSIATKIRAALTADANVGHTTTGKFVVSGDTNKVILTAKVAAANDATLNIAIADGTSVGVTTAASSANTTPGSLGTGAKSVVIEGVDAGYNRITETVYLNGTTTVNTSKSYRFINYMTVSTGAANIGNITATAAVDGTVTSQIRATVGESRQAYYMVPNGANYELKKFYANVYNTTGGAYTTVFIKVQELGKPWITKRVLFLNSSDPSQEIAANTWMPSKSLIKISATVSAGSSEVYVYGAFETV